MLPENFALQFAVAWLDSNLPKLVRFFTGDRVCEGCGRAAHADPSPPSAQGAATPIATGDAGRDINIHVENHFHFPGFEDQDPEYSGEIPNRTLPRMKVVVVDEAESRTGTDDDTKRMLRPPLHLFDDPSDDT